MINRQRAPVILVGGISYQARPPSRAAFLKEPLFPAEQRQLVVAKPPFFVSCFEISLGGVMGLLRSLYVLACGQRIGSARVAPHLFL
jgi:hypothetical protein